MGQTEFFFFFNLIIINIFQFDRSLAFWGVGKHKVPMSIYSISFIIGINPFK